MIDTAQDLALETLSSVVRIALAVEVLRVDTRDEAGVAWHALVTDLVSGTIHPSARGTAHVANHGTFLRVLVRAVHRG